MTSHLQNCPILSASAPDRNRANGVEGANSSDISGDHDLRTSPFSKVSHILTLPVENNVPYYGSQQKLILKSRSRKQ